MRMFNALLPPILSGLALFVILKLNNDKHASFSCFKESRICSIRKNLLNKYQYSISNKTSFEIEEDRAAAQKRGKSALFSMTSWKDIPGDPEVFKLNLMTSSSHEYNNYK